MPTEHFIEEESISMAWGRAALGVSARGKNEVVPLIVSITGFDSEGAPFEKPTIRTSLDTLLAQEGMQSIETVASTLFPQHMWNPKVDRGQLFERYKAILPKLRAATSKNSFGIYFERMITGGPKENSNQLDFIINSYRARKGVRRSILQLGIFHPVDDLSTTALRGFPCLQHITFVPTDSGLAVNAFYATQYIAGSDSSLRTN
jgi:hypothetical protein